jgi:transcriptional regulator with XRE-family HTH domain
MNMNTDFEKLDRLTSSDESGWAEKAKWREENKSWLDLSSKIALKILRVLRERGMTQRELSEKMGVSPQYVNKILKGKENLSLETIVALGKILSVDLFLAVAEYKASIDKLGVISLGDIRMNYISYGSSDVVNMKSTTQMSRAVSNTAVYNNSGRYDTENRDFEGKAA